MLVAPRRPAVSAPSGSTEPVSEQIPPEVFDQIMDQNGGAMTKTCPYCTFENPHTDGDCDVCGLPLG